MRQSKPFASFIASPTASASHPQLFSAPLSLWALLFAPFTLSHSLEPLQKEREKQKGGRGRNRRSHGSVLPVACSPKGIRVRRAVPCRRCSGARRGPGFFSRAAQGAPRPETPAAVAARREHGRRAEGDILASRPTGGSLQTPQIVYAHLVAGLLGESRREVACIAASDGRSPASTLTASCCFLGLGRLIRFRLFALVNSLPSQETRPNIILQEKIIKAR